MKTLGSILYSELAPPTRGITYSYFRETEKIIDPKLSVEHTLTKKYEKHLGIGRNTLHISSNRTIHFLALKPFLNMYCFLESVLWKRNDIVVINALQRLLADLKINL